MHVVTAKGDGTMFITRIGCNTANRLYSFEIDKLVKHEGNVRRKRGGKDCSDVMKLFGSLGVDIMGARENVCCPPPECSGTVSLCATGIGKIEDRRSVVCRATG